MKLNDGGACRPYGTVFLRFNLSTNLACLRHLCNQYQRVFLVNEYDIEIFITTRQIYDVGKKQFPLFPGNIIMPV